MAAEKIAAADPIPSYLIECLVWNAPDSAFLGEAYVDNLKAILAYLHVNTQSDLLCSTWCEVNALKLLFGAHQPWTRSAANEFVLAAWNFAKLK